MKCVVVTLMRDLASCCNIIGLVGVLYPYNIILCGSRKLYPITRKLNKIKYSF